MDFLTATVLSGIVYDMLKNGIGLSVSNLNGRLKEWMVDEIVSPALSEELNRLNLTDEMSEKTLEKEMMSSPTLIELLGKVKRREGNVIIQSHSGSGDNIGGNKVVN